MKMKSLFLIILLLLFIFPAASIELFLTDSDLQSEINLDFAQGVYGSLIDQNIWLLAPELEIAMTAQKSPIKIEGVINSQGLFTGNYDEILKKAALYWELSDDLLLKIGQFKNPFGQEINRGLKNRAYTNHSVSSKQIAPGYSRGVSLENKNIMDMIKAEIGLFSGGKITDEDSTLTKLLATGAGSLKLKLSDIIDLKLGYSILLDTAFLPAIYFQFAQAISLELVFNFGSKNDLKIFSEFMEDLDDSLAYNHHPIWSHGVFGALEYRIGALEPFITAEHYKARLNIWTPDDLLKAGGGCNVYLEEDIRIQGEYDFSFYYWDTTMNHELKLFFYYNL